MFSREQVEAIENFVNAIIDNRQPNSDCGDAVKLHELREAMLGNAEEPNPEHTELNTNWNPQTEYICDDHCYYGILPCPECIKSEHP